MPKQLVQTTGAFELVDYSGSVTTVITQRPTVVDQTNFVQERAAKGQIRVLENELPDDATDAEFANYWKDSDGDKELAVESFKSSFTSDTTKNEPEEDTPRRRGRQPKTETPAQE